MPPLSFEPGLASPGDLAECRARLRQGSRTFSAASLLLPASVREAATGLYAFCRLADDAVDLHGGRQEAVDELHRRLGSAYAGTPWPDPVDRAFADVVARYAIPRAVPEALLEGFLWDAQARRYETLAEVEAYAVRVAGTVGIMMTLLMGCREPATLARACDLGVAMQLSNIARDVGEDARAGRIYLPLAWLREAGIDPDAWLRRPRFSEALGDVIRRLLRAADRLYERAGDGIDRLPAPCRPGIQAARYLYGAIGHELERRGLDSVGTRTVVPGHRKLALLTRSLLATVAPTAPAPEPPPPLPDAQFLLDAVAATPPRATALANVPFWDLRQRIVSVLDLFERLERRELARATGGG
jgi:phytoene synthase